MHVAGLLRTDMFQISIGGRPATMEALFPGWTELDRLGLVIDTPLGGVGATHLVQCAMMAYYDARPTRRSSRAVYPEIYAFHIGKSHGAHAPYDFWPARREVILRTDDHREVLDAINDRGITRLAVPDRPPRDVVHRPKEVEAALDDVNLRRLLTLLAELRQTSQLIIITHQKRTMEIADALYGVTMRDGTSTVVSQRMREGQPAVA